MNPWLQDTRALMFAVLLSVPMSASAQSLKAPPDAFGGSAWTTRVELDARPSTRLNSAFIAERPGSQSLHFFGDYQFSDWRLGNGGGLRLTSGIILSARTLTVSYLEYETATALPYAGIGYSASSNTNNNWAWSADVGFTANGLGSLRLDRLLSGSANLSTDGNMRLLPQIRLGMRLQF